MPEKTFSPRQSKLETSKLCRTLFLQISAQLLVLSYITIFQLSAKNSRTSRTKERHRMD